ncbi:PRSS12, partial [Symbiodinium microadriaticum]
TAGPSDSDVAGSKPEAGSSWDSKSSAHRQMQADVAAGRRNSLASVLEDIFAGKSTSTLHTRAGPVARYMSFCKSQAVSPFPITESSAYHYMQVTGEKCAATYLRSFVGTLAFLKHVTGAFLDDDVFSPRITGLAAKHYMTKRKLQQKPPLHAKHVFALEEIVCGKVANYSAADKVAAGFFLFAIYARARHSDAQNSSALEEDLCEDEDGDVTGFLEARIERSKTSTTLERKTRWLPMVATIHGISDQCWGLEWMKVLAENGPPLGPGRPLLPGPMENGQWQNVPLSPEASARWLRGLLYRHPADFPKNEIHELGTHSLKATLLSWCSKYGLSLQTRAILGYHSKSKGSVLVYGRDNISQPLRELDEVIRAVAFKRFFPDSLRSGYFKRPKDEAEQPAEPLSDSSSEDSQDEERPDHRDEEEALQLLDPWEPFEGARELVSGMLAFRLALASATD